MIEVESFHCARAPGIVVGALMLDTALTKVKESEELAIVVETFSCLPDAVQILTPCTTGNGGLKVYDWGKFALTAYDKGLLKGVRTYVVHDTVAEWPLINQWFNPSGINSGSPDFNTITEEFFKARADLIGIQEVTIVLDDGYVKNKKTGICEKCGDLCSACQGMAYYR